MDAPVLEMMNVTKTFPGVKALDNVQFRLDHGQIHAIMGENGAGKSTFIKIITGVHAADSGQMLLNGQVVHFKNPNDAQKASIAAIYQHSTSYPHLSVAENIFIGHEQVSKFTGMIDWKAMYRRAEKLLAELDSHLNPRRPVGSLTVAERQIVEVAKAISTDSQIVIMDEPTASLSSRECEKLYQISEKLRDKGTSIIFISHRFEDMYRLADKVTVFRDGKYIGTWEVAAISEPDLIKAMVGREIERVYPQKSNQIGQELLRVEGLSKLGFFKKVNFSLRKGEILGFSGLVGSGRTDLMQCLAGVARADQGQVFLEGRKVSPKSCRQALKEGIGLLPEDRQGQGLILEWEIYKNVTLSELKKYQNKTVLNEKKERATAKKLGQRVSLKAPTVMDKVSSLSGGNQQKVVFCKLLNSELKVLILDEPTKGVDVGAKSQIYEIINDLAAQGYGVIFVSSDMPELLGVSDRIMAMHEGVITGEFLASEVTQEKLLLAIMNLG
ncbi:MAG: sugar ABC transporter ATP-binding protein [Deltaproteobacteria bacterium]|jgi:rhamnose transport system ATP-binding protein|nr:sugar ABC transporter ATP-binding protein [Deltaproteobacteria bacterium]